jgi:hypothetical protein
MLLGAGVRPGQSGQSDEKLVALPISARTGKPDHAETDFVPTTEDLGTTLLSMCGSEAPWELGYPGRILEFLRA